MNKFVEMLQKGEDLIARTNELLANDLDLNVAGTVDIATYLSDLKAVHADSLAFTDDAVMADLVSAKGDMSQEEYFDYLARFSQMCREISGNLRDRIYDRTAKFDIAFNNKNELYRFHNETITSLNADVNAYNRDLARIDRKITRLRDRLAKNENAEVAAIINEQINSLEDERDEVQAKKDDKLAKIEEHRAAQKKILYGGPAVVPAPVVEPEQELEEQVEETPEQSVNDVEPVAEEEEPELENPPVPEETPEEVEELPELPQEDEEIEEGMDDGIVPAFPGLDDDEEEIEETPEEVEEELPELPEEIEEEENPELPQEEEEEQEVVPGPVPTQDDDEPIEVIHHTDAKPTLLQKIGKIINVAAAFLSFAHFGLHLVQHNGLGLAHENESQLDEDDLEDVTEPEETTPEDTEPENTVPDTNGPSDTTPEDTTPEEKPEDTTPEEKPEDTTPEEKPEDTTPEEKPEETTPEEKPEETVPETVAPLPAELEENESIVDRETGMEVTHTGDSYLHQGDVTTEQEDRDLIETDHNTNIVVEDDLIPDQQLPDLTGDEQTYEEAVENMTEEEVADLDAAIAEWAASFDASQLDGNNLTLTP